MSPSIGASAQPAGVPGAPAAQGPGDGGVVHEHAWSHMRFELVGDRPVVRQSCEGCGLVRGYRAWERSWAPGTDEIRR